MELGPIILHHGFGNRGQIKIGPVTWGAFRGIDRTIRERGYPVIVTRVHPTASIESRAVQLKRSILEQTAQMGKAGERAIIIAHSMGGLDARYMISRLGMGERVAALVTISTPHRGTPYADWCLKNLTRFGVMRVFNGTGLEVGAVRDLTVDAAGRFNEEIRDVPGVAYYSISAARHWKQISPLLLPSYRIIYKVEGENDGLVSVSSAKYGRHLGTWEADHWHVINRRLTLERPGKALDIRGEYLKLVGRLEKDGVLPVETFFKTSGDE